MQVECQSEEELEHRKSMALRAKCIVLVAQGGLHPLHRTTAFKPSEKRKLLAAVVKLLGEETEQEIMERFNELVNERLLDNDCDISQYACGEVTHAPPAEERTDETDDTTDDTFEITP